MTILSQGNSASSPPATFPTLALSMGDPLGIGPEIIVKALADPMLRSRARFIIVGSASPLLTAARAAGIAPFWATLTPADADMCFDPAGATLSDALLNRLDNDLAHHSIVLLDLPFPSWNPQAAHTDSADAGRASFDYIDVAIALAKGRADALVTAPISKKAWDLARLVADSSAQSRFVGSTFHPGPFPGHTELLAERFGAKRCSMLFVGPSLRVILATIHVPLAKVPTLLTTSKVFDAIELAHQACIQLNASSKPRIAVLGLNPHAGESGLLGSEDDTIIRPAVEHARSLGIDALGPLPADTLFSHALLSQGRRIHSDGYDCVVAMYHDQGLIPVKLVDAFTTVNVTVGLHLTDSRGISRPVIRTSPAHGTAFDIAGKNAADPAAMTNAIKLALDMAHQSSPANSPA